MESRAKCLICPSIRVAVVRSSSWHEAHRGCCLRVYFGVVQLFHPYGASSAAPGFYQFGSFVVFSASLGMGSSQSGSRLEPTSLPATPEVCFLPSAGAVLFPHHCWCRVVLCSPLLRSHGILLCCSLPSPLATALVLVIPSHTSSGTYRPARLQRNLVLANGTSM